MRIGLLSLLRAALVVLAVTVSATALPRLGSFGPDLVLLVVVAAALLGGPAKGAILGLGAGWVIDLMPPAAATLGVAALTYAAVPTRSVRSSTATRTSHTSGPRVRTLSTPANRA